VPRRAFAALVVLAAIASAGCGASRKHLSTKLNSPSEVRRVFAAHGLRLDGVRWTRPTGDINAAVLVADEIADAKNPPIFGRTPLHSDPRQLNLTLTVWWSDAAARKAVLSGNAPNRERLTAQSFRWIGTNNVTAAYLVSPYTKKLVARLTQTMAALANTPAVKAPA
jgi:hypothetical protein